MCYVHGAFSKPTRNPILLQDNQPKSWSINQSNYLYVNIREFRHRSARCFFNFLTLIYKFIKKLYSEKKIVIKTLHDQFFCVDLEESQFLSSWRQQFDWSSSIQSPKFLTSYKIAEVHSNYKYWNHILRVWILTNKKHRTTIKSVKIKISKYYITSFIEILLCRHRFQLIIQRKSAHYDKLCMYFNNVRILFENDYPILTDSIVKINIL